MHAKFQLFWSTLIFISCKQLLSAADRCKEKNLKEIFIYVLKMICVPNFSSLGWFLFSSDVNSCWMLLTADDSCHKQNLNGIFTYPLKLIPAPNFSSLGWFSFYQLSTDVDSFWQLMRAVTKNFEWDFHLPTKADTCAKFQLSRLIFIFISCQQLLTTFDSWWELSQKMLYGIFIYPLKLIPMPNFSSLGWFSFFQLSTAVDNFW